LNVHTTLLHTALGYSAANRFPRVPPAGPPKLNCPSGADFVVFLTSFVEEVRRIGSDVAWPRFGSFALGPVHYFYFDLNQEEKRNRVINEKIYYLSDSELSDSYYLTAGPISV
jgi:hypothetical protein